MSTKRTSSPNSDSVAIFQHNDDVKRVKLTSRSDTTLEDLPLELIQYIFVKAITLEVEDLHLVKSVWKKKADLVISRLRHVCPQWGKILTSEFFQNELYRNLDRTVEKTIRLEILCQSGVQKFERPEVVTLMDEVFVLRKQNDEMDYSILVYDRNNLGMLKDIIVLPELVPEVMESCSVSNCLYILNKQTDDQVLVVRMKREGEHQVSFSPLICGGLRAGGLSVSANGNIILWQRHAIEKSASVFVFDPAGSLQYKIKLKSDLYLFNKLLSKSNGDIVLVTSRGEFDGRTKLTEIDTDGSVLRQYESSLRGGNRVCHADLHGQIFIFERPNRYELLDDEFNPLNVIGPNLDMNQLTSDFYYHSNLHYNAGRKDVLGVDKSVLYCFRFTEK